MKRAFTLIELLVVIAIIAILAAILFPVFAQAKEAAKKTTGTSNAKQFATGILIYCADYDDFFPAGNSVSPQGVYWYNYGIATPAGWDYNGAYEIDDAHAVYNSGQPYMKNYGILTSPGLKVTDINPNDPPRKTPMNTSLSVNGLLQYYSMTAVAQPSRLTMVWWGNMQEEIRGYAFTNPTLRCTTTGSPCIYNPGGYPQTGITSGRGDVIYAPYDSAKDSAWVYSKGMTFVACDSSAKHRPMNPGGSVTGALPNMLRTYQDPTLEYRANGQQWAYHRCRQSATAPYYLSFFRPDNQFQYEFGNDLSGNNPACNN